MNADFLYILGSYIVVLLGTFLLLNFLSNGGLRLFLIVKASRGNKVMVRVHQRLVTYTTWGVLEGRDLLYHDRESKNNKQKVMKRVNTPKDFGFYRYWGVWACDINEETNNFILQKGEEVSGFDALRWNNLLLRALMKPASEKDNKIFFIVIIIALFVLGVMLVVVLVLLNQVNELLPTLRSAGSVAGVNV